MNSLRDFSKKKNLVKCIQVHSDLRTSGLLEKDTSLGSTLVSMYVKCGALTKAQEVLDDLPVRGIISWSALISGYAQQGSGKEALDCYEQMRSEGLSPDAVTYACVLKACGTVQEVQMGKKIHDEIVTQGLLEKDVVLGTALLDMYAKRGLLVKAQKVLDELPVRDFVCWSALIAGYTQQGQGAEALHLFERMRHEGVSPNSITYSCTLKACSITKDVDRGKYIHVEVLCQGLLEGNIVVGTALVDMYAKFGMLTSARQVHDQLPVRNVVSWSALICGYSPQGLSEEAIDCFHRLRSEGLSPNAITYSSILKACGIARDIGHGKKIHGEIFSQRLFGRNTVLGNALVDMYAKCGALVEAARVLDEIPARDVVSWSALIAGYVQQGQGEQALDCYDGMQREGIPPNAITYACILRACGMTQGASRGELVHDEIVSRGLLIENVVLGNTLVDMYVKCSMLRKAQEVVEELPRRDVITWSTLIAGYAQQGQGKEALTSYEQMCHEGIAPNAVTYACILKACGLLQDVERGRQIHDEVLAQGILGKNTLLGNALVDMYAKCGVLVKAQEVLDQLRVRDVVTWNALISGYAQQGEGHKAMECFDRMQHEGLSPDPITYACILKICGIMKEVEMGKRIRDEIESRGLFGRSMELGNALVDMYVKCGMLMEARHVLDELPARDVCSWNALITGYAQQGQSGEAMDSFCRMGSEGCTPDIVSWNALIGAYAEQGQGEQALGCFGQMQRAGISSDAITFVSMLNACSHSGLVEEGKVFFEEMEKRYDIVPNAEHHICMIDLFCRAGQFDKAVEVTKVMRSSDYPTVWSALLNACQNWKNVKLGRWAFQHALQLNDRDAAAYVCMGNVYASAGMQEDARKIEAMRVQNVTLSSQQEGMVGYDGDVYLSADGCYEDSPDDDMEKDCVLSLESEKDCGCGA